MVSCQLIWSFVVSLFYFIQLKTICKVSLQLWLSMSKWLLLQQRSHLELLLWFRQELITCWEGFVLLGTELLASYFEALLPLIDLLKSLSIQTLMYVDGFVAATADSCEMLFGVSAVNHLRRWIFLNKLWLLGLLSVQVLLGNLLLVGKIYQTQLTGSAAELTSLLTSDILVKIAFRFHCA